MTLKPTLKEKHRYLLVRFSSEAKLGEADARHAVYHSILRFLGELGFSQANPKLVKFDAEKQEGVFKVVRGEEGRVKAALALAKEAGGKPAVLRVVKVSGAINKLGAW